MLRFSQTAINRLLSERIQLLSTKYVLRQRAPDSVPQCIRLMHSTASLSSVTGVSFSPVPPHELKVAQWMKAQEIAARRKQAHSVASKIWSANPSEQWCNLTRERSEALLNQYNTTIAASMPAPSDWDVNEFLNHTLQTHCKWRYEELLRERKAFFEVCLEQVKRDLRAESDRMDIRMQMTKNELTRKLTNAMGGKLPTSVEVDEAWQDRHQLPAIEWMEDVI